MNVFVLAPDEKTLMPTTPRRARMWLKQKRARIVNRTPFTIQLCFEPSSRHAQRAKVGVDTGSKTVGVAAVANSQALYQAEISLRTGIKRSMDQRRQYRRNRPNRHTRYRQSRFKNRKEVERLVTAVPSLESRVDGESDRTSGRHLAGETRQIGGGWLRYSEDAGTRNFRNRVPAGRVCDMRSPQCLSRQHKLQ